MPAPIACPGCQTTLQLPDALTSRSIRCSRCQHVFPIPSSGPTAIQEARPALAFNSIQAGPAPEAALPPKEGSPGKSAFLNIRNASQPVRQAAIIGAVALPILLGCFGIGTWLLVRVFRGAPSGEVAAQKRETTSQAEAPPAVPLRDPVLAAAIKPPTLENDRVVRPLPGAVADVAVGGAGRFLILHLPNQRQLVVFDVNEAKIVKSIAVSEGSVKFAAGLSKLLIVAPGSSTIERWNLSTLQRETAVNLPIKGVVKAISMGSASEGPLLVHWAAGSQALDPSSTEFFDIGDFKPIEMRWEGRNRGGHFRDRMNFRALPDGHVFGAWCTSHSPSGLGSLVLLGRRVRPGYQHESFGHVVPGMDGLLYTGKGIYTTYAKPLRGLNDRFFLPAHHGPYFAALPAVEGSADRPADVAIHVSGETQPVTTLKGVKAGLVLDPWSKLELAPDKRLHLIPAAKLVLTIPPSNDRLELQRLDFDSTLDQSGIDFLCVTSPQPRTVAKGTSFDHQLAVKARNGPATFRLDSGPQGMTVSPAGRITWKVPSHLTEPDVQAVITIGSKSGLERVHTITLGIEGNEDQGIEPDVRAPTGPFLAKANPKPEDFVGKWVGKWDNVWRVHFTITQDPRTKQLEVLYEWEEVIGQPFHKRQIRGSLDGDTLVTEFITIQQSAKEANRGMAVGHFANRRIAHLLRVPTK